MSQPNEVSSNPIKVFISYSHVDDDLCQKLIDHLASLERRGKIKLEREPEQEIDVNLKSAKIILLLVSSDFMASNDCKRQVELAMNRYHDKQAWVIPIILRSCDWHKAPFCKLSVLPKDGKPACECVDDAFSNIAITIRTTIDSHKFQSINISESSAESNCPYPGLKPLDDRKYLFGRDIDIKNVTEKLELNKLVFLIGESGVGKTSLAKAGIVPLFTERKWITAAIWDPSMNPISDLKKIFYKDLKKFINPNSEEIQQIDSDGLTPVIDKLNNKLLLIIDNFRKILDNKSDEAKNFIDCITHVNNQNFATLIVARTSYLGSLASYINERDVLLDDILVVLKNINSEAIEQSIIRPAEFEKYKLENGLSSQILSDLTENIGLNQQFSISEKSIFLPILQLTLTELWDKRDKQEKLLTQSSYEKIKEDGGAIDRHFDSIYMEMTGNLKLDKEWIRLIILKLVHVEQREQWQDTRRWSYKKDILDMGGNNDEKEMIKKIVEELIDKRVLTIHERANQNTDEVIEIAYDFISIWKKLIGWINYSRGSLWISQQIKYSYEEWKSSPIDSKWLPKHLIDFIDADESGDILRWCNMEEINCFLRGSRKNIEIIELSKKYKLNIDAKNAERHLRFSDPKRGAFEAIQVFNEAQVIDTDIVQDIIHKAMEIQREKFCIEKNNENPEGHTGSVKCVTVSPDKKYIASSGRDKMIFLWDAEGNYKNEKITGHQDIIWNILFSSCMKYLFSSGEDGKIFRWNLDREGENITIGEGSEISKELNKKRKRSNIETLCIRALAISAHNKYIAVGSKDGYAHLWELARNNKYKHIHSFKHDDWVMSVVFSLDEKFIYTGCARGEIRCWDISDDSKPISTGHGHKGWVRTLAINEKYLVSGGEDKTIRLWDLKSVEESSIPEKYVLNGHEDKILTVSLDPNTNFIASGSADKTIRLWDFEGNQLGSSLKGHTDWVRSISILSHFNNQFIVSASRDSTIRIWDLEGNISARVLPARSTKKVISVTVSHDKDNYIIASGGEDTTICLWDKQGKFLDYQFTQGKHNGWIRSVKFTPDNNYVITGSADFSIGAWNLNSRTFKSEVQRIEGTEEESNAWIRAVDISDDGKYLISASDANTFCVWQYNENQSDEFLYRENICKRDIHDGRVTSVAFSPSDKNSKYLIASASEDRKIRLWNLDGDLLNEFIGHKNRVLSVRFSPDSSCLISGSQDQTLRLWKITSEKTTYNSVEYSGHTDAVRAVVFSPDGKMVISGGADSTIRIWDLYGNQIGDPLTGHRGTVRSLEITPDGKFIISGSEDGTVRLWNLGKLEDWVKICCDRIMKNKCSTEEHKDEVQTALEKLKKLNFS